MTFPQGLNIGLQVSPAGGTTGGLPPGGGGGPDVNAVNFDGTNDYLLRGAQLTGAVDSEQAIISLWFNMQGGDGVGQLLTYAQGGLVSVFRSSTDKIQVKFQRVIGGATQFDSTATFTTAVNPGWHHLLVAADFSVPSMDIYLDDAALAGTFATGPLTGNIDWTVTDWAFGAVTSGGNKFFGDLSEVYMNDGETMDITVEDNRRKFIGTDSKPVGLGADGSTPTGTAPIIFLSGDTVGWHTNLGGGGGFTENGALTDASSSPSD